MNSKNIIKDALSWEDFYNNSEKRKPYPPKKVELFNRLICHTNNFFVIAAIGAFTPGYVMLVTKNLIPSMGMLKDSQINELKWLINVISEKLEKIYNRDVVCFEHGMCSCVGGLDRAHLHIITIKKNISSGKLINSINAI